VIKRVIGVAVTLVVLGVLVPVLWPLIITSNTNIQNISGSDAATAFLKVLWPITLILVAVGIAAGLIFYVLRKFGIIGK
jgi:heme/copper-type cytochrome/quinol oxidase subunit 2